MGSTQLSDKHVKTRKSHTCHGCGKVYPAGSDMQRITYAYHGEGFWSFYFCHKCESFMNSKHFNWNELDEGLDVGDLTLYEEYADFGKEDSSE